MNRYSTFDEATIEANRKSKSTRRYYTAVRSDMYGYWLVSMRYDVKLSTTKK